MNIKHKILAIFILTLAIGGGGGYLYYSLITQRIVIGEPESMMYEYYPEPVVVTGVNLSNVNVKKVRRNLKDYDALVVPDAGRKLPSEGTVGSIGSSSGTLRGFGEYSYRNRTIESTNGGGGGAGGGMMAYRGGSRSGGGSDGGGYSSGGGMTGGTSPLLAPINNNYKNPPTTGNGIILVDPMTETMTDGTSTMGEKIPVGEGLWILLLMALVYGVVRRKTGSQTSAPSSSLEGGE